MRPIRAGQGWPDRSNRVMDPQVLRDRCCGALDTRDARIELFERV